MLTASQALGPPRRGLERFACFQRGLEANHEHRPALRDGLDELRAGLVDLVTDRERDHVALRFELISQARISFLAGPVLPRCLDLRPGIFAHRHLTEEMPLVIMRRQRCGVRDRSGGLGFIMFDIKTFTLIHVGISLLGIVSGFVVVIGLVASKRLNAWTAFFLATTIATSLTGFGFPIKGVTPGIVLGVISLFVLAIAVYARYAGRLSGPWRLVYVVTAVIALYLNFFVLIVQSFLKLPALNALAPTGSEPPLRSIKGVALVGFVILGVVAAKQFREHSVSAAT